MLGKKIMEIFAGQMINFKNFFINVAGMAVNGPAFQFDAGFLGQVFQGLDKRHTFVFL